MKKSASSSPLLVVAGALVALVVADRFGLIPGRGDDSAAAEQDSSPRARYMTIAAERSAESNLIGSAAAWRDASGQAQSQWSEARKRLVAAPTVELAESRLREIILAALVDLKVASPRVTYIKEAVSPAVGGSSAPVAPASPVRSIGLRLEFDTTSHRDAYIALDRVRNVPDAAVSITSLSLSGPGRVQLPEQITVSVTLRAAAVVGGEP